MASEKPGGKSIDAATGTETVGHEWDGIEELDTPMPRWWLIAFYITIVWGVIYVVLYPAWPLVSPIAARAACAPSRPEVHGSECSPCEEASSISGW